MRTSRRYAVIAFVSIAFLACHKEDSASKRRLVMIRTTEGDSISWRTFSYDAQNRLSFISDSNNNGNKRTFVIGYDVQGKLSQAQEGTTIFKFEYDDKGRVAKKIIQYPGQPAGSSADAYSYDANNKVIADSSYWSSGFHMVTYSYDAAGNVTASKSVVKISGMGWTQEQLCTYDNHPNPLAAESIMIYLFDSEEGLPAGKNNLLKQTFDDGTIVTYQYSYQGDGLPKNCTYFDNTDPLKTLVEYFYE